MERGSDETDTWNAVGGPHGVALVGGSGLAPHAAAVTPEAPAGFAVPCYEVVGDYGSLDSAVATAEGDTVGVRGIRVGLGERGPASVAGSDSDFGVTLGREVWRGETPQALTFEAAAGF